MLRSAALTGFSLMHLSSDRMLGKTYFPSPVMRLSPARFRRLVLIVDEVVVPHFHLRPGDPPERVVQIRLAPFGSTQLAGWHEQECGQLKCSGGVGVALVAIDCLHKLTCRPGVDDGCVVALGGDGERSLRSAVTSRSVDPVATAKRRNGR